MTTLVWFRQDLRISDNPALFEAARKGEVLAVYVLEDGGSAGETHPLGGASRWWLHHSLAALCQKLPDLALLRGDPRQIIPQLAQQHRVRSVVWNRCYEPQAIARDTAVKSALKQAGIEATSFKAGLLFEPWELQTKSGGPFKVYTPFWKAAQQLPVSATLPAPPVICTVAHEGALKLDELDLLPEKPNWAAGWEELWQPGEVSAHKRLENFLDAGLQNYGELRNRPDKANVSRLSAPLHFGEISPRQVWQAVRHRMDRDPAIERDGVKFLSEIAWREFSHHLIYHFPEIPSRNWRPTFDAYPWRESSEDLARWQSGQTGYPIVDAGMRELWQTGYMHNRVRMIAASFLVKHLRLHWSHGETWFRDTLVDADLANNAAGWQWVAGSGADAAPYFRVFNPITQGAKFDPDGEYTRKWVPELGRLATVDLFAPFEASGLVLEAAGVRLGETYPHPIVDHASARKAALAGYEAVRQAGQNAA